MAMVDVTYHGKPGDPLDTEWQGFRFEHGKPTAVPEGHPLLVKDEDGKSPVDYNDWFSTPTKRGPGRPPKDKGAEPETPEEYFTYAVEWMGKVNTSAALEKRWDREEALRDKVGWGSDDEDRIAKISQPKLDSLKKAERTMA